MLTEPLGRYPEQRRLVTVLFADVQGFTALAEQLDSETVSDLVKGIWLQLDKAIELHNGYLDKHLGDGVMAVWGAPYASDYDAEEAISAGLDLLKALNKFCQETRIRGAENLKLRVGINSGQVFAGYIGTKNEYTVIGDTVNVASRLEQMAEPGTVVIGENTLPLVQGSFRVRRLEPTRIKGKTDPIQPYAIEGRLTSPGRIRYQSADRLETNMVGREEEIKKLNFLYERAYNADLPLMALLIGDVGIGKSRLLMEFSNTLEYTGENIHILSSRGLAQAAKVPFYLWRTLLRNRFAMNEDDTVNSDPRNLDPQAEEEKQNSEMRASRVLSEMMKLTGREDIPPEHLQNVFFMTRELLRHLSARKKLILLLDDLQWADRESLQLLAYLLSTEVPPLRMMLVGAARPEFIKSQPHWHNQSRVMNLPPLELNAELVAQAYPDLSSLPEAIREQVALRAEGNPYFLEEIAKNLIKALPPDDRATLEEICKRVIQETPESLRATLQARLDHLSREARTVAMLAAVVGRVFWVGAVMAAARSTTLPGAAQIINIPEPVIDRFIQDGLRQLVRAELAFPRSGSRFSAEQEYIFKNSYLRDVAYGMIPNRNRIQYHKAVAEWLREKVDPVFQSMAREHEQSALRAAKITTGTLTAPNINHHD